VPSKKRKKQFKEIEAELKGCPENELHETMMVLDEEDFSEGTLSTRGYHYLKEQCAYINDNKDVQILVPLGRKEGLQERLKELANIELRHINKDKKNALIEGIVFFMISILFGMTAIYVDIEFLQIFWIGSWAFGWYALDKIIFDRRKLQTKKNDIFQMILADIVEQSHK
jgi:hypothetical protein